MPLVGLTQTVMFIFDSYNIECNYQLTFECYWYHVIQHNLLHKIHRLYRYEESTLYTNQQMGW